MTTPDWRSLPLADGVLREPGADNGRLVLWVPSETEGGYRFWDRVGSVPGAEVTSAHGVGAVAATASRARQRVSGGGLFGKLFGRRKESAERSWVLPTGEAAEPCGERRSDLVLAWAEDPATTLDETRLKKRWPKCTRIRKLGRNLVLVSGVEPPAPLREIALPQGSPTEQAERALAAARQAGDRRAVILALTDLGIALTRDGDKVRAVTVLEEALALARELGDRARECDVLGNLGWAVLSPDQRTRSLALLDQALALAREVNDRFEEKAALYRLGNAWSAFADPFQASAFYDQALSLARTLGDRPQEAELLWCLAIEAGALGRRDEALTHGQSAVDLLTKMGHAHAPWFADNLRQFRSGEPGARLTSVGEARANDEAFLRAAAGSTASGPGVLRMALSATKALAKFVGSGLKTVPADTARKRLAICVPCEHHTGVRCRVCGCFTAIKVKLPHESCPIGKWPA